MKHKIFLILFFIAAIGELISTIAELPTVHLICKPLLLPSLIAYYWVSTTDRSMMMLGALVFSWIGDVLLMDNAYFIFGLISFLVSHILYIVTYKQHQHEETTHALHGLQRIRFAFPVLLAGTGLIVILWPHLNDMKYPVLVYAGVITFMTLTALFRFGRTSVQSFAFVFGGAILFMISDSLLAVNKFIEPIAMGHFWIMLTYCGAQILITIGILRHQ